MGIIHDLMDENPIIFWMVFFAIVVLIVVFVKGIATDYFSGLTSP